VRGYRFLSPAAAEVAATAQYYEDRSPGLGAEFIDDLNEVILRACEFPDSGAAYERGTRRILFRRFPFELIYEAGSEPVVVIAVAHQRRRPGYWRGRI
jgi:plasmid stabilization system protein ParE